MHPTIVKFGPLSIHSYGLFVALGFLTGILIAIYFAKKEKINPNIILDLSLYVIISGIIGARLFYVLGQWDYYKNNPLDILMVQNGGLVIFGGFIFAFFAIAIYAKQKKLSLLKLLDAIAPGLALGYAIGRIGCFLNGCCFGLPTSLLWGMVFPPSSLAAYYYPGQQLHPTQIYSSLAMLAAFFVLIYIYRRKRFNGQIAAWFFVLYSVYRFFIEFFRYSPIHWLALTPSQWLAIFISILGIGGLFYYRNKSR